MRPQGPEPCASAIPPLSRTGESKDLFPRRREFNLSADSRRFARGLKHSVIVATHARPALLARLLASLAPQLHSDRDELIIADNGTAAPSTLAPGHPPLQHLHDPEPGKCRIVNRAIGLARGETLVLVDDDVTVAPGYLDAVEEFFREHPEYAAMKGRIHPEEDPYRKIGERAAYLDLPYADHGETVVDVHGVLGANMAFRRSVFDRVGLFDERLGPGAAGFDEETEFSTRLRNAGLRIGYSPTALVYHAVEPARATRDRFLRTARERGRCRVVHEAHSTSHLFGKVAVAWGRTAIARAIRARFRRIAREEYKLEIARGMFEGRHHRLPAPTRVRSMPQT